MNPQGAHHMVLHSVIALLFALVQTPQASPTSSGEANVFIDLGTEHCAQEIAIGAYEFTDDAGAAFPAAPTFVTYSAFEFESSDQATSALEDVHVLVAQTYSNDPDIEQVDNFDQIVAEVPSVEDYGDERVAYIMSLPVEDSDLEVLTLEMLGIVKESQLMLIIMTSGGTDPVTASPGVALDTIPPFAEDLDEQWDGQGDLTDAIPTQDEMPVGWTGQDISEVELPDC